jgi:D-3-phosphoglycerate dehydrogenase
MSLVVITDCDHPSTDVERRIFTQSGFEVRLGQCRTEDEVIAAGEGAVGLLVQYAPITDRVMAELPTVRTVGRYGVSLDTIDLEAAARRGIAVVNVPDYCTNEVADHALALILSLTRGIAAMDRGTRRGVWDFRLGGELRRSDDMQLGIVGLGRIGTALARRALALHFRVMACDPQNRVVEGVKVVDLNTLLETSDVVSLNAPLNDQTRHLIGASALARMKDGAYLVNTSRGGLVDTKALVGALSSGRLAGAALDVVEVEPIPTDSPLLALPNVVITPHAAFYSRESLIEMKRRVSEGMVSVLGGPALEPVLDETRSSRQTKH